MTHNFFQKLDAALQQINRPGSFCVGGSASVLLPGLEVDGLGPITLPFTEKQANELKKHCEQAPYGKGEETLVDTSVRRVWRLTPDHFTLTNPDWETFLKATVHTVQEGLGLEKQKLESHLYDLLLYEPGSFFLPHRDGEKLNRMVATLVIVLPSSFEGGELLVRHEGKEQVFDFGGVESQFRIHYAAFYADCEHEIRPLRAGHRLCLVYNLTLAQSKKAILAPRSSEHIEALHQILAAGSEVETPQKVVVNLSHQYTQDGLTWDTLKGVDRAQAHALLEAARRADWRAYLAMLTLHESGSAEYAGNYRRRRSWDEDEDDPSQYTMGEVFESSLTAERLVDGDGLPLSIESLPVNKGELLHPESLKSVEPEEEFEGYTGNAGMTLDHWYRQAAILLWPKRRHFDALCAAGSHRATQALTALVQHWRQAGAKEAPALKEESLAFAAAILRSWQSNPYGGYSHNKKKSCPLFSSLIALNDSTLIDSYVKSVLPNDATVDPGESLASACQKHGWETFANALQTAFRQTTSQTLERNSRLLESLCLAKQGPKPGHSALCESLAPLLLQHLRRLDDKPNPKDWGAARMRSTEILTALAQSFLALEQDELLAQLVEHTLAHPKKYPLLTAHLPALTALQPWIEKHVKKRCAPMSRWLAVCREKLEALTDKEPQPPADFRRSAAVSCKCNACAELKRFMADPRQAEHRFRAVEHVRRHLQEQICMHHCDLDYTTEKKGSPHTLICTKNTASYQARLHKYHEDRIHLKTIQTIEASVPS